MELGVEFNRLGVIAQRRRTFYGVLLIDSVFILIGGLSKNDVQMMGKGIGSTVAHNC